MTRDDEQAASLDQGEEPLGRLIAGEAQQVKAKKFFEHAQKAADTRNYEYAIKLYVDGLALWPDAIEEGLRKLRVVATARKLEGGKPLGFMAARKCPVGGKNVFKSLKNALTLFGLDPTSLSHMEQILHLATKAKCDRMVEWIAPVLTDAYNSSKKLSDNRYATACQALDTAAELAIAVESDEGAQRILEAGIAVSQIWCRHHPEASEAQKARSDASGKLTILKGRFSKADGFVKSLKNAEAQQDLQAESRTVRTAERNLELIAKARKNWEDNPGVSAKLLHLVDLMVHGGDAEMWEAATALLEEQHASTGDYTFKRKADDLQMRQLKEQRRQLQARVKADPNDAQLRQALADQTRRQSEIEIKIFEDRVSRYPTDLKLRHALGSRLFRARRYDEAIPLFQQAQADGRCRSESRLYLGRCFYEKGFTEQAVGTLQTAIQEADTANSPLAMELKYWLARGLEASNRLTEAKKAYGDLIQFDYNFRDARSRLEKLVAGGDG